MANINKSELTKEQIQKAMDCKNAEELIALAKAEGVELTREEAVAYIDELQSFDLDIEELKMIAGGACPGHGPDCDCYKMNHSNKLYS